MGGERISPLLLKVVRHRNRTNVTPTETVPADLKGSETDRPGSFCVTRDRGDPMM